MEITLISKEGINENNINYYNDKKIYRILGKNI